MVDINFNSYFSPLRKVQTQILKFEHMLQYPLSLIIAKWTLAYTFNFNLVQSKVFILKAKIYFYNQKIKYGLKN